MVIFNGFSQQCGMKVKGPKGICLDKKYLLLLDILITGINICTELCCFLAQFTVQICLCGRIIPGAGLFVQTCPYHCSDYLFLVCA